jgi:uncharacterized 2Fe-2S/4Fe-4S cluster protein (DUF4445 family)
LGLCTFRTNVSLLALLDLDKRKEADKIAEQVQHIELTREPDFAKAFARACIFRGQADEG